MRKTFHVAFFLMFLGFFLPSLSSVAGKSNNRLIKILIFSGKSNHEWRKTTPLLQRYFEEAGRFETTLTNAPDTLKFSDLKKFDLIVSNANTWPDNEIRMQGEKEADFSRYVREGGGALFFHASASSYYGWTDYQTIGIGRWGKETFHNAPVIAKVYKLDQQHPITKGMVGFRIMDEIWEKTELISGANAIGFLSATNAKDGHPIDEPAIFVNRFGKGRTFFTILGHDERAMVNGGLRTLLLRAAQWCAGKEVTILPPAEISISATHARPKFSFAKSDTTFALCNRQNIVWQFNYNDRFQRPYFHPLSVDNTLITCVSPPDHPWHLGLWFCWKYINHLNYWEYLNEKRSAKTGYRSEGTTEIVSSTVKGNPDFSATIHLKVNYHPLKGENVMVEDRDYYIAPPALDGSYYMDETHLFTVIADSVVLDRTPPAIRGGRIQGGYAGISIRFNQDFTEPEFKSSGDSAQCKKCDWQYYGFTSLTGKKVGIKIEQDPEFRSETSSWYIINDPLIPFYYFSPAVIFDHPVVLKKGASWKLKYRIQMMKSA